MTISEGDQLLEAVRAGDGRALGLLIDRRRSGLQWYCYLMLGDRVSARAAFAETALAAWQARGAAQSAASARIWLYRLAIRACAQADPRCAMSFDATDRLTG